ncbi:unnamed protein product [Closterium sp. NIES-53]
MEEFRTVGPGRLRDRTLLRIQGSRTHSPVSVSQAFQSFKRVILGAIAYLRLSHSASFARITLVLKASACFREQDQHASHQPRHVTMAFLACVLLLAALLSPATVITGAATTTALDGAHSSSVVTKRLSRRALPDATFVAEFRRPSVARRLSAEVAQPAAASPPGDASSPPFLSPFPSLASPLSLALRLPLPLPLPLPIPSFSPLLPLTSPLPSAAELAVAALVALTGWEAAEMCSQWMGVICDGRGMVTDMNLGGQGLAGPIPMDAFCNLTALQELELSFSPLTGSLEFLDCLPALQYLDLHATELTGEIPVSLGKATALSYLNLGGLDLAGPIPMDAFCNLTALQELDLSFNGLTGSLEFLDCLPALQSLDLLGTALTGEIPASLGKATALTYLSLGHIDLAAGELPASLSALTNLAHLDLSYLKFTSLPSWIGQLPHLQFLDVTAPDSLTTLFSPARSSPFPADWTALTSLNTLRAAGNGFSGSLPTTISTLTALSELYASHESSAPFASLAGACLTPPPSPPSLASQSCTPRLS